jgi:molybdate transport system permease protein
MDLSPLWISLATSIVATAITLVVGVAAAAWREKRRGFVAVIVDCVFLLPLVLPPTVVGFLLLLLFGRRGPIGSVLEGLGTSIVFSWPATVLAAATVAFPLMYLSARAALEQVDPHLAEAARTLGANEWRIFREISIPLAWPGLLAGVILTFARALGEFGATLMIAGDIPGHTETIPLAIYFAVESGDMHRAWLWCIADVAISLALLGALYFWTRSLRLGPARDARSSHASEGPA